MFFARPRADVSISTMAMSAATAGYGMRRMPRLATAVGILPPAFAGMGAVMAASTDNLIR